MLGLSEVVPQSLVAAVGGVVQHTRKGSVVAL